MRNLRSRKIGAIVPIWNQQLFIKPHFTMLSKLDKIVVLMQKRPLPNYHKEHGYSTKSDYSEYLIRKFFPQVEIHESTYPEGKEFGADLYNEGLKYVQDCDIVFRLDPDMFFEDEVWDNFIWFVRNSSFDCYRFNFAKYSVNYYKTWEYSFGLKDAKEFDPLAFNPKYPLATPHGSFEYPHGNEVVIKYPDIQMTHFRGWNKKKSVPSDWQYSDYARTALALYGNNGEWFQCPESIKKRLESWRKWLEEWSSKKLVKAV